MRLGTDSYADGNDKTTRSGPLPFGFLPNLPYMTSNDSRRRGPTKLSVSRSTRTLCL